MKQILALLSACLCATAAAQTAAPAAAPEKSAAPVATPPQKPAGRPLILRLDEIDGPRISIPASPTEKPPEKELPTLGGQPSKAWERPSERTFPIDSERANQFK